MVSKEYLNETTKAMVAWIFRNGVVEDYHAAGCLSDAQMKAINMQMVNRLGYLLYLQCEDRIVDFQLILGYPFLTCRNWNDIDFSEGEDYLREVKELTSRFN